MSGYTRYTIGDGQTVNMSGKAGESFSFGGYSRAESAPITNNRNWNITVKVYRASNVDTSEYTEDKVYAVDFNPYSTEWQYALSGFTTEYDYSKLVISMHYDYQINTAYFDEIQLYRTPFVTEYNYESNGNLDYTQEVVSDNTDEEDTADNEANPTTSKEKTTKDNYGRIIEEVSAEGVGKTYNYDSFDNVLLERVTNGRVEIKTTNTYSSDGNYLESQTDELGNKISYTYDSLGNMTKITDAEGNDVDYTYDANGNATKVSQTVSGLSNGNKIENTYTYDNSDRLSQVTHNGFNYVFMYNPLGALSSVSTPRGNLVSYTYSSIEEGYNLKKLTYGNGQSIDYGYNKNGILNSISSNNNVLYNYFINPEGITSSIIDNVSNIRTDYTYDADGNKVTTQSGIGNNTFSNEYYTISKDNDIFTQKLFGRTYITSYNKDKDSRNNGTSWQITETESKDAREEIFYDDLGRTQSSVLYTIDKDENGNLKDETQLQLLNTTYAFNDMPQYRTTDQVYSINLRNDAGYSKILSYEYNKLGYISRENGISYTYDEAGQLKRVDNPKRGTTTYQYDNGGNIVSVKSYAYTEGELGSPNNTITYGYDAQWKDLLTIYNGNAITYDTIGNPLSYYDGKQFTWSMGRQLSGISGNGSTISYKYNESGIRTSKTIDGNETKYIYADDKLTGEVTGNKQIYYRYDSDGNVIALEYNDGTSTNTYYYVKNLQGDIISILDKAGNDVVSYEYNEWGKIVSISGTLAESIGKINPFRYRSYYFDEESGFFYVGSRYYDPNTGRFLNADEPALLSVLATSGEMGVNLFAYCSNNPVNKIDPNGYMSFWTRAYHIAHGIF